MVAPAGRRPWVSPPANAVYCPRIVAQWSNFGNGSGAGVVGSHLGLGPSTVHRILTRYRCLRLSWTDPATRAPLRIQRRRVVRYEHRGGRGYPSITCANTWSWYPDSKDSASSLSQKDPGSSFSLSRVAA